MSGYGYSNGDRNRDFSNEYVPQNMKSSSEIPSKLNANPLRETRKTKKKP